MIHSNEWMVINVYIISTFCDCIIESKVQFVAVLLVVVNVNVAQLLNVQLIKIHWKIFVSMKLNLEHRVNVLLLSILDFEFSSVQF